ncbi:STAS domain-containing protein [Aliiglaciecola sp. CAU 1673]|uniref:STAS domain-containing protein n=1 Tax=Aliiglaciecola sp. CAU 1673 TaxID=3032595 RepID=UPI0023DBF641|nr:STAS domain-containing protein [Aliiglaciecola sp. CAU 1673]MDF2179724.1 STAS domain-containing protein [Aliiglaciecola sp. CAU 1673]
MTEDQVLFAKHGQLCVFKFTGNVRHTQSAGLDHFVHELFSQQSGCDEVLVDLRECHYLDSTSLGLLALIARLYIKLHQRHPSLLVTEKDMQALLCSMCLDKVFTLVNQPTSARELAFAEMPAANQSEIEHVKTILKAHEELLTLDEGNRQTFQPVVDLMKQELAEKDGQ